MAVSLTTTVNTGFGSKVVSASTGGGGGWLLAAGWAAAGAGAASAQAPVRPPCPRPPGILLNNQMDDFSTPGQPNIYGVAPSRSNFIRCGKAAGAGRVPRWPPTTAPAQPQPPAAPPARRPGKRPFSSMAPLIVERDGALLLAVGGSGGPRIISAVLQACVR